MHSACAKAGVLAMTRTLAVEWARHGIRVVGDRPRTARHRGRLGPAVAERGAARSACAASIPLQRFARLQEVADAAAYLCRDHAAYVTGEVPDHRRRRLARPRRPRPTRPTRRSRS